MKSKDTLLAVAVMSLTFGATTLSYGELTSVLEWTGDEGIVGDPNTTLNGSITDVTAGGSPLDIGLEASTLGNPDGVQLKNISDGVFDPGVSIARLAGYSYVTTVQTASPGQGPADPVPVVVFDLGADTLISGYQIWNYRDGSNDAHMVKEFRLRFATAGEGREGLGSSIDDVLAEATIANTDGPQTITPVVARYIEFSMLSRHDGRRVGVEEIQFDLAGAALSGISLADFSYDPATGAAEVTIEGAPNTNYKLVKSNDLDFSDPIGTIILSDATAGSLDGINEVTTNGQGRATVQFNLGAGTEATFLRAEVGS